MDDQTYKRPNAVISKLVSKIASTTISMREKTESINCRVHHQWSKQQSATQTRTRDQDFENLVEELDAINEACQEIIKLLLQFITSCNELVNSSQRITNTVHLLLSTPKNSKLSGAASESYERRKMYLACINEIQQAVRESVRSIPQTIFGRLKELILHQEKIYTKVTARDKALNQYDKIYDRFDALTILSTTNDLTTRQKITYDALEKKLEELKITYDNQNNALKLELPTYFMLVRTLIESLAQFLFYIHLTVAYQFQSNLISINDDSGKVSVDLLKASELGGKSVSQSGIVRRKKPDSTEAINGGPTMSQKKPIQDTEVTGQSVEEKSSVFCRALFDFTSSEDDDLQFKKGDIIEVIDSMGEWWIGRLRGKQGLFPHVYIEELGTH